MFTGIIEEIGKITGIEKMRDGLRFTVSAQLVLSDLKADDSISIDGACQTVIKKNSNSFTVEAVGETIDKTILGQFQTGRLVNLERSLTLQTRLGGHLIQGHVNDTARVTKWYPRGENRYLEIEPPADLIKYFIREGSVAINGISLTIAQLDKNHIGISIIPHTVKQTTLQYLKTGETVNIEVDMIARYVEQFLNTTNNSGLTIDKLKNWGY